MKIIVSGSRTFEGRKIVEKFLEDIISKVQYDLVIPNSELEVLSGNNPSGAEHDAERWTNKNRLALKLFPADWNNIDPSKENVMIGTSYYGEYNKLAGFNRNSRMVDYAVESGDVCLGIAFDAGTKDVKDAVKKLKTAGIHTFQIDVRDVEKIKVKEWNKQ